MLHRLADWLSRERLPKGYRPGATLQRVRGDLNGLDCAIEAPTRMSCQAAAGGLSFEVLERVEALFLSHTVLCEFVLRVPSALASGAAGRITLRHTGAIQRQGIACVVKQGNTAELNGLATRLQHDAELSAAILPLDFRRCELVRDEQGWQVLIEHFGASEVVNRFPSLRRYIRLTAEQRRHLLDSLAAFRRLLV